MITCQQGYYYGTAVWLSVPIFRIVFRTLYLSFHFNTYSFLMCQCIHFYPSLFFPNPRIDLSISERTTHRQRISASRYHTLPQLPPPTPLSPPATPSSFSLVGDSQPNQPLLKPSDMKQRNLKPKTNCGATFFFLLFCWSAPSPPSSFSPTTYVRSMYYVI